MKCNPQLVLQIVVTLLSGYSRMNAKAKQKKHQKQLDEIINNQNVIREAINQNNKRSENRFNGLHSSVKLLITRTI